MKLRINDAHDVGLESVIINRPEEYLPPAVVVLRGNIGDVVAPIAHIILHDHGPEMKISPAFLFPGAESVFHLFS